MRANLKRNKLRGKNKVFPVSLYKNPIPPKNSQGIDGGVGMSFY